MFLWPVYCMKDCPESRSRAVTVELSVETMSMAESAETVRDVTGSARDRGECMVSGDAPSGPTVEEVAAQLSLAKIVSPRVAVHATSDDQMPSNDNRCDAVPCLLEHL